MKRIVPIFLCLVFGLAIFNSCKKDPVIPTLSTSEVINITINSATTGGVITKDGGAAVTARGICWGTSENPLISGSHSSDNSGVGSFVSNLTDLTPNTVYHIRAYATNKAGTAYGKDISFTTSPVEVPTLTTAAVTSITLTTAVSGGNITADGNAAITAKGVCWATTATPTISNSFTTDGTGIGSFISTLTGLLPGTVYYIRAYATNSVGTAYGDELTFTTTALGLPVLATASITSITQTTAVSGGNITSDGGAPVTVRGICWATTTGPTTTSSKTSNGTGPGIYTSNITGLTPGTIYYVRAYAANSVGTAYGNEISFSAISVSLPTLTTAPMSSVTATTAVSGGNVLTNGGGTVTGRGVCWSLTASPTILNSNTSDGTGTGAFVSNLTGLTPGATYYLRAYAVNAAGPAYGTEITFTTLPVAPTVTTTTASAILQTTATAGGNVTNDGGGTITARGTCWALTANPTTTAGSKTTETGTTGAFVSSLTSLLPGTVYHYRAYATNSAGTSYGTDFTFTTLVDFPTVTTTIASSIAQKTAVAGGNVTSAGGGSIIAAGTCWSTTANPTISGSKTTDATATGSFVSNLSGLNAGTLYHYRAYATNSTGTSYGNDFTFTTLAPTPPVVTTAAVTSITNIAAVSGGSITSDGNGIISAKGVCWSTSTGPTVAGPKTNEGAGTASFVSNLGSLLPGTTYYVRAYATNSLGTTAYGNELSFNTKVADGDGNLYNYVVIGTQTWLTENLKTTSYSNGVSIGTTATPTTDISAELTPKYQWPPNGNESNVAIYGRFYTWYVATDARNVCPTGWHVPTDGELETLKTTIGGESVAGGKLKEMGLTHWQTPNTGATNDYGFTALPSGYRLPTGGFISFGFSFYIWSSEVDPSTPTFPWGQGAKYNDAVLLRGGYPASDGVGIRCIKN
jgi:uncharacterized protein (TIGR02145 family)